MTAAAVQLKCTCSERQLIGQIKCKRTCDWSGCVNTVGSILHSSSWNENTKSVCCDTMETPPYPQEKEMSQSPQPEELPSFQEWPGFEDFFADLDTMGLSDEEKEKIKLKRHKSNLEACLTTQSVKRMVHLSPKRKDGQ